MDNPLPCWQKPQQTLSPGRVAQSFALILAAIGTPAQLPKSCGKAPGWPKGKKRTPKQRYPIVKKRISKDTVSSTSPKPKQINTA